MADCERCKKLDAYLSDLDEKADEIPVAAAMASGIRLVVDGIPIGVSE